MANPNTAYPTSVTVHSKTQAATTTLADILANAAASGKAIRVSAIYAANIDGANDADVTVSWVDASDGVGHLAKSITVAAQSTLIVTSRETAFYLNEDCQLRIQASANNDINVTVCYEEIS